MAGEADFEVENEELRSLLNTLGRTIGTNLPKGWGFTLLLFSFGDDGATFYISNASRDTMIPALQEFVDEQKRRQGN